MAAEKKITVMIVDDEEELCKILGYPFEMVDCNVLIANNGQDALKTISASQVDVVIADVRMKGGDGLFLLEEVKKMDESKRPFVFLMSGHDDITNEEAQKRGAKGFLSKPFNAREVVSVVLNCFK